MFSLPSPVTNHGNLVHPSLFLAVILFGFLVDEIQPGFDGFPDGIDGCHGAWVVSSVSRIVVMSVRGLLLFMRFGARKGKGRGREWYSGREEEERAGEGKKGEVEGGLHWN